MLPPVATYEEDELSLMVESTHISPSPSIDFAGKQSDDSESSKIQDKSISEEKISEPQSAEASTAEHAVEKGEQNCESEYRDAEEDSDEGKISDQADCCDPESTSQYADDETETDYATADEGD